jgi:hypothetical protein
LIADQKASERRFIASAPKPGKLAAASMRPAAWPALSGSPLRSSLWCDFFVDMRLPGRRSPTTFVPTRQSGGAELGHARIAPRIVQREHLHVGREGRVADQAGTSIAPRAMPM